MGAGFEPAYDFRGRFYRPLPLTTRPPHRTDTHRSRRWESNPQPAVYKTAALPIELRRRNYDYKQAAQFVANGGWNPEPRTITVSYAGLLGPDGKGEPAARPCRRLALPRPDLERIELLANPDRQSVAEAVEELLLVVDFAEPLVALDGQERLDLVRSERPRSRAPSAPGVGIEAER